jgi:hypothetical protein
MPWKPLGNSADGLDETEKICLSAVHVNGMTAVCPGSRSGCNKAGVFKWANAAGALAVRVRNVLVGVGAWEQQLETNKVAYFNEVVTRPAFLSLYGSLSNAQYVDALNANTKHPVATQFLAKAQRKSKGAKSNLNNSGESKYINALRPLRWIALLEM